MTRQKGSAQRAKGRGEGDASNPAHWRAAPCAGRHPGGAGEGRDTAVLPLARSAHPLGRDAQLAFPDATDGRSGSVLLECVTFVDGELSQAELALLAVTHPLNTASVELVGLADTGLAYLPMG